MTREQAINVLTEQDRKGRHIFSNQATLRDLKRVGRNMNLVNLEE